MLKAVRWLGVQAQEEPFDPATWKTKIIFMASQLAYTALTLLPPLMAWRSYTVASLEIFAVFCVACYNGGRGGLFGTLFTLGFSL